MRPCSRALLSGSSALLLALMTSLLGACGSHSQLDASPAAERSSSTASVAATTTPTTPAAFAAPDEASIPNDGFGKSIKLGRDIFMHTGQYAKAYVGNPLNCASCHMDAGRLANSGPLWGAYDMYPAYRSKNGHVNSFAERLQGCFMYSMNGKAPPLGDDVLVALESYAYWMSRGVPLGKEMPGRGYPKLAKPAQTADFARGEQVFQRSCALCHGADGQGQQAAGSYVFPPLWGPQSFNWGAGMHELDKAAGFIKANMPLGRGNSLSDQDAWDVAYFMSARKTRVTTAMWSRRGRNITTRRHRCTASK
ncbi:c-type cytochrome [Dyella silvatica]|uniref:c-type cytochrome n=1 Tax=Dyella silvatica TaxID=2992128 RepID=UPI00225331A1|nr:c-type cytochrome [Dyella silvatica]